MKMPPLLMGAALLFWGWAIDMPTVGGLLAVAVEGARLLRTRWHLEDEDFNRLWNFCSLIFIGATVYAFTANQGAAAISRLIEDPSLATQRAAGESSQRIAASLIQWQPMIFFPFLFALVLSGRDTVKLVVFSLIARRAKRRREPSSLADYEVHVEWVFFAVMLVSATINNIGGNLFFPGLSALIVWALWVRRWPAVVLSPSSLTSENIRTSAFLSLFEMPPKHLHGLIIISRSMAGGVIISILQAIRQARIWLPS